MLTLYRTRWRAYRNRLTKTSPDGEVVYELRSGARFTMNPGEHGVRVLNGVWLDRLYEPVPSFRPTDGWTVVDLGAHKGAFTVRAALSGPKTRVYAAEPAPFNIERLRRNLALNRLANVHVYEGAVSATSGRQHARFSPSDSGRGSLVLQREHDDEAVISTLTLDDFLADVGRTVDLMKMDIEGAEYEVLGSASPKALRSVNRIVLEYHARAGRTAEAIADELSALLHNAGFQCDRVRETRILYAWRSQESS